MDGLVVQPSDLVEAGLYGSEGDVIQAALAALLNQHPDIRIALAVHQYEHDEGLSLGGAAERAGVTRWEMMDILASRGIEPRLGPATIEEAREEAEAARRWFREHHP